MTPFYYLPATWSDAWRQTGPVRNLLQGYFESDGGFLVATGVAIIVALVFSLTFYLMGRKFSLAKKSIWFTMLVLSGLFSFVFTALCTGTVTGEDAKIGITGTFETQKNAIKNSDDRTSYVNTIKGIKSKKSDSMDKKSKGQKSKKERRARKANYLDFTDNPVAITLSCLNIIYTMILFWAWSLLFKWEKTKITKFAYDIPHKWPQRK